MLINTVVNNQPIIIQGDRESRVNPAKLIRSPENMGFLTNLNNATLKGICINKVKYDCDGKKLKLHGLSFKGDFWY